MIRAAGGEEAADGPVRVEGQPPVDGPPPAGPAAEVHHTHRDVSGGWLRPAVFGVTDGLVSNFALIAGVAGGHAAAHTVTLTGLAGLVAGSFSMATGEYVSVTSQSELARAEIAVERAEIRRAPAAEQAELAALYRSRGVSPDVADEVARQLSANPEQVWRVHAREELGVDPDDLPSGWVAAASSFASFALGALLPLLPYLFGSHLLAWSLLAAGLGLLVAGAITSRFTDRGALYAGVRQLAIGALAAGVTYGVGRAIGASVS